jgi:hypothetical protein
LLNNIHGLPLQLLYFGFSAVCMIVGTGETSLENLHNLEHKVPRRNTYLPLIKDYAKMIR